MDLPNFGIITPAALLLALMAGCSFANVNQLLGNGLSSKFSFSFLSVCFFGQFYLFISVCYIPPLPFLSAVRSSTPRWGTSNAEFKAPTSP